MQKNHIILTGLLFAACIIIYSITNVGLILSPDSELVFRQAKNLARHGSFAVEELSEWKGFGVARGKDNQFYPVFGVGEAIAFAAVIRCADLLHLPKGPRVQSLLKPIQFEGTEYGPTDETGVLRFYCSFFNAFVTAFTVFIFYRILRSLGFEQNVCTITSVLYAFGTIAWTYADTTFSEPLATLFLLLSFWLILLYQTRENSSLLIAAGLLAGLATVVHITAILSAPFLLAYCIASTSQDHRNFFHRSFRIGLIFLGTLSIVLAAIAYYNLFRFGNIFETGRTIDPFAPNKYEYGVMVFPWKGLYGLLLSPPKGLLVHCPIILLSLYFWRSFHRERPLLSWFLASMSVFRLIFIATRSDWHGGFCLGPRFLVMMIPFLMIPLTSGISSMIRNGASRLVFYLFSALSISQQLYFSFGEIFTFFFKLKEPIIQHPTQKLMDAFYVAWSNSPLFSLHHGLSGPLLLRHFSPQFPFYLWLCISVLSGAAFILVADRLAKQSISAQRDWTNLV